MSENKHIFALYYPDLEKSIAQETVLISNPDILFRIQTVLRLKKDDTLILFNPTIHATVILESIEKKKIIGTILLMETNTTLSPYITAILPLLKKQETEEAVSRLCQIGVNRIQLVNTEKTQRGWGGVHELVRLERICISSAEQSKHFAFPSIGSPINLFDFFEKENPTPFIFCDPKGDSFLSFAQKEQSTKDKHYSILVGPEGDLSVSEKNVLSQKDCIKLSLTPTILRAQDAIVLACGMMRTLLK